jgi:serine/threonine protein kinase
MILILMLERVEVNFKIFEINIHHLFIGYLAFIVMELGGDNLMTLINRSRLNGDGFGSYTIKAFWRQMVSIVYSLQRNGIVHMDLKPANLILFGRTLKIADLGISRKVNALG